jgi:hypothetical protein
MVSLRQWQNEIAEGGNKARVTAATLHAAETTAHSVYDATVREMTYSGQGVTPHGGNNEKMVISQALSMLARGWNDLFKETVVKYGEQASVHPVRFVPLKRALESIVNIVDQAARPAQPRSKRPARANAL